MRRRVLAPLVLALLVFPLLLSAVACEATPPRSFRAGELADVWAPSEVDAAQVSEAYHELAPAVAAELPGTELRRVEIWVREGPLELVDGRLEDDDTPGMYLDGRIHVRRHLVSECCGENAWRMILAHELVHHLLDEGPWHRLPLPVEEGLCDAVAERVLWRLGRADESRSLRAARLMNLLLSTGALDFTLRVDGEDSLELTDHQDVHAPTGDALHEKSRWFGLRVEDPSSRERAVAFVAMRRALERYGWSFLRATVEGADGRGEEVEPALLLLATGLGDEPAPWLEAARELYEPADLARSVECFPWLADWLAVTWPHEPGRSLAWLADRRLQLRWLHDEAHRWVDISDCVTFDADLRARDRDGGARRELE